MKKVLSIVEAVSFHTLWLGLAGQLVCGVLEFADCGVSLTLAAFSFTAALSLVVWTATASRGAV